MKITLILLYHFYTSRTRTDLNQIIFISTEVRNYNNNNNTTIADIGSPEGLAIDWVSRNIYWTDSTKDTIEVANLETKLRKTLFDTKLVNPRGIAVHPQRG